MSTLLSTLPSSIRRLLRRGSPVVCADGARRGVVAEDPLDCNAVLVCCEPGADDEDEPGEMRAPMLERIALDLTDPTGRWHAACWAAELLPAAVLTQPQRDAAVVLILDAQRGADMSPEDIDRLARLVLRLAAL